MQPGSFQTDTKQPQSAPEEIGALKEQIRIMQERLATLKEQLRAEQRHGTQSRLAARVAPEKCTGCAICQDVCPVGAISIVESVARIDATNCTGCGRCVETCPRQAIALAAA
jgi:heterodisulfide reductase subunit A-like polyferredoxin